MPTLAGPHSSRWIIEEDILLISCIARFGISSWQDIGRHLSIRTGVQCSSRWNHHLQHCVLNELDILKYPFQSKTIYQYFCTIYFSTHTNLTTHIII